MTEREYFTRLFEQYHGALYSYAFTKTNDSFVAQEIAHTTYIKFWQHYKRTNARLQEQPEKLLFFIAKALLVDHYRKKITTVSLEQVLSTGEQFADDSLALQQETLHFSNLVRSAAETLPDKQRVIFEMSYFQDCSHEEIAAGLNLSRQTVKNLLTKARKQVRKLTAQQFLSIFTGLL